MAEITERVFDPAEQVNIKNICPWGVNFKSLLKDRGEHLAPFEETTLSAEEIAYQIKNGNSGFVGVDGMGSHAPLQLTNLEQYNLLFGCQKTKLPEYLNEAVFKKMVKLKDETKFKAALEKNIKTESDKHIIIYLVNKNDKIRSEMPDWMIWAIESYTWMKITP